MNKAGIGTAAVLLFMGWTVAYAGYTRPAAFALYDPPVLGIPAPPGSGDFPSDTPPSLVPHGKGHPSWLLPDGHFFNLPIAGNPTVTVDNLNDHRFTYEGSSHAMRSLPGSTRTVAAPCSGSHDVVGVYVNVSGVDVFLHTPDTALPAPGAILLGGLGTALVIWMRRTGMV